MLKWTRRVLLALLAIVLLSTLAGWWLLRGSLPVLDGEQALPGLAAPVSIQRDTLGVVTIDAASQDDALRALGYVHAQERYFEMDLMRRSAAGELSALFGAPALPLDRERRVHRLRARIEGRLAETLGADAPQMQAYVAGVNAGLGALRTRPWPYLLLRQAPRPWQAADSALAGYAMYFDLQDAGNHTELAMLRIRGAVPAPLYALLAHAGSSWDAPLEGPALGDAPLPGADVLDLRALSAAPAPKDADAHDPADGVPGSNNFAVAGSLTADGRAILADDMHLGLRAPGIWFRVRLRYPDPRAPGGRVDVAGFTLPGLPAVVAGSNGHVAWGFTNAYADTADWASLPADAPLRTVRETLEVAGAPAQILEVRESDWGPVLHDTADGRHLALRWVAHLPGSLNLGLKDFARARDLDEANRFADRAGLPAQNLLLADRQGRIGWRILGALPDRAAGCAEGVEVAATASCPPWPAVQAGHPALLDPADGRLWTANARVAGGAQLQRLGDGGYDLGARAGQIRDGLRTRARFDERALLAIQLDDRALFLQRWWQLLRATVEGQDDPALRRLEAASRHWDGRASVDSASYRIARGFRGMVLERVQAGLLAPAREALGDDFIEPYLPQLEGVLWPLVSQRPPHLLPPGHASWDALLADAARALEKDLAAQGTALEERTWGERNTAAICHPLAAALPAIARRWLCMPPDPLPGDNHMPRVQGPSFGASERMVVAPGHEADGIVHMPGGQSGHLLSPFWGAGHEDWVAGRPTPFLPGPARHTLRLAPAEAATH